MDIIGSFREKARGKNLSVVLPEGRDERIIKAARILKDEDIARPIVLGKPEQLEAAREKAGVSLDGIEIINPKESDRLEFYSERYSDQREGISVDVARRIVVKPLFYGGMMVACGDADTAVGGVASATTTLIQAGVLTVGLVPGIKTPSSYFLMVIPSFLGEKDKAFIYADCAVNVDPSAEQLADIALASAVSARRLLGQEPRVALLSFSTKGSGAGASVDKVREALQIARQREPGLAIDGEFQADSAIIPRVAAKKVKGESAVAGEANVIIFPDLNSGNIAYKLTQYMADAQAIGPFLQGFAKPITDLSRGATVDDIVATVILTLGQLLESTARKMKVLVINAGSSSVKYHLYRMPQAEILAGGFVERIGEEISELSHFYNGKSHTAPAKIESVEEAMELILQTLADEEVGVLQQISEIDAVGHRVVHGGEEFTGSVVIDEKVIASIEKFADLAPLHNPPNLAGIRAAQRHLPNTVQVACFDTAFHATIPKVAYMYALPYELYEKYGIRRYGFHGISHRYVARRAAAIMGRGKYDINAITCHLGNGCSITAVKNGRSIDTSMGLTPLEGVPMGTRSGDLDPAILFYLADKGYSAEDLKNLCNTKSGLLGISCVSNDVRNLEELAAKGHALAQLAIDVFCYRIKKYIGAYAAVLDTVDAVVFTGGIGENAVSLREKICNAATQIGVQLDYAANKMVIAKEAQVSTKDSQVKVFVIPTNEQAAIANDTYELARRHTANCLEEATASGQGNPE